ncbi:hypothetical protein E1287_18130 [Actinomadura sp. KC06]|uniref:hypothetical protein n=1 Tax=Actinomadura sp. KC06 TaxID=2530369 RepID=UPI001044FE52|nr:hypothetical protein [Actinomadura sp. KC06]TDD33985.1 hypothetical protein E1287_18130 [Actinomadura sp. KC06]
MTHDDQWVPGHAPRLLHDMAYTFISMTLCAMLGQGMTEMEVAMFEAIVLTVPPESVKAECLFAISTANRTGRMACDDV